MEAGGDAAAVCENAGGKNKDILKTDKITWELKIYKWARSKIKLK